MEPSALVVKPELDEDKVHSVAGGGGMFCRVTMATLLMMAVTAVCGGILMGESALKVVYGSQRVYISLSSKLGGDQQEPDQSLVPATCRRAERDPPFLLST